MFSRRDLKGQAAHIWKVDYGLTRKNQTSWAFGGQCVGTAMRAGKEEENRHEGEDHIERERHRDAHACSHASIFNPGSEMVCVGNLLSVSTISWLVTPLAYQLRRGAWVALALTCGSSGGGPCLGGSFMLCIGWTQGGSITTPELPCLPGPPHPVPTQGVWCRLGTRSTHSHTHTSVLQIKWHNMFR